MASAPAGVVPGTMMVIVEGCVYVPSMVAAVDVVMLAVPLSACAAPPAVGVPTEPVAPVMAPGVTVIWLLVTRLAPKPVEVIVTDQSPALLSVSV